MTLVTTALCGVAALVALFVVVVLWDVFMPKRCASCGKRGLRCLNFVRSVPGPNYSTFRCQRCGDEFVQVSGRIEARKGTKWEHEDGW